MTPDDRQSPYDRQTMAELLAALCDRSLSPAEMRKLDELVRTDGEARRLYVEYLDLHARLVWQFHATSPGICLPMHPSSFVTHSFLSGGVLLSYLFAAVLLAAGAVGAFLAFGVGGREAASNGPSLSKPVPGADAQGAPIVGYVTSAVDCRWAEPGETVATGSAVPMGRQYALESGFLEITYGGGERIILQGPAKYQARWFNGGFLSAGKLTAYAVNPAWAQSVVPQEAPRPRGGQSGGRTPARVFLSRKNVAPDPVSGFRIPVFSFFVRTPSTLAISRSAQFELSVDPSGSTQTRLVLGMIEAWYPGGGKPNDAICSSAREAWSCVGFTAEHDVRVTSATGRVPDLMRSVFADLPAPDRARFCGPSGGRMLRIAGLESQPPGATAGQFPAGQPRRTTN
jgi:hypothetical protein